MSNRILIILSCLFFPLLLNSAQIDPHGIPERKPTQDEEEQIFFQHLPQTLKQFQSICEHGDTQKCLDKEQQLFQDFVRFQNSPHKLPGMSISIKGNNYENPLVEIRQTHPEPKQPGEFSFRQFVEGVDAEGTWKNTGVAIKQQGTIAWPSPDDQPINIFLKQQLPYEIEGINRICKRIGDAHKETPSDIEEQCKIRAIALTQKVKILAPHSERHGSIKSTSSSSFELKEHGQTQATFKITNTPTSFNWESNSSMSCMCVSLYRNQQRTNGSLSFIPIGRKDEPSIERSYSYTRHIPALDPAYPKFKTDPAWWILNNPQRALAGSLATIISAVALKKTFNYLRKFK